MNSVSISNSTTQVSTGSRTFIQRHAVPLFFLLAFGLTWAIQVPLVLDARGVPGFDVPDAFQLLQGFMPGIAAVVIAALASGRAGSWTSCGESSAGVQGSVGTLSRSLARERSTCPPSLAARYSAPLHQSCPKFRGSRDWHTSCSSRSI